MFLTILAVIGAPFAFMFICIIHHDMKNKNYSLKSILSRTKLPSKNKMVIVNNIEDAHLFDNSSDAFIFIRKIEKKNSNVWYTSTKHCNKFALIILANDSCKCMGYVGIEV